MAPKSQKKKAQKPRLFNGLTQESKDFIMNLISLGLLKALVDCSLSESLTATRGKLRIIYKFVKLFVPDDFPENIEKAACICLLHHVLHTRIVRNISSIPHIAQRISALAGRYSEPIDNIMAGVLPISDEEMDSTLQIISQILKYANFTGIMSKIQESGIKLVSGDYESLGGLFEDEITPLISEANMVLRQTRYNTGCSVDDFDTSKEGMSGIYTTVFDFMNNKGSSIHTGLQQLDNMLSGRGFEAGTVTLFLGVTGGWKSGMLLNCASWFTRYNANCQSFDATKIPCCIYYSLENSMVQTAQRWYAIRLGPTNEMTTKYANSSEVADALHELDQKECGGKVKVFFRYRKPRSTSADDIASEIEALKEEGYEPKMVILDYIKNMAPNDASITDERLRLGEIGNNIQSLAKEYKLALVTAQQINREGIKAVEGANELKKKDASKSIQASHAANSWDLIELMDMTIVLHCDYKIIEGVKTRIISLRKFKSRREQVSPVFFTHPFVEGRQMLLNEDIGKKCLSFDCCANDGDIQTDEEESPRRTKFKSQVEDPRAANRKAIAKFNKGRMGSSIDDEDDDDNGGGLLNGDEIL